MARLTAAAQDKQWQREDDARTLARAEEIKNSPVRLKGAVKEANVMVQRVEKEAKAMKRVAAKPVKPVPRKSKPVTRSNKKTPLTRSTRKRK